MIRTLTQWTGSAASSRTDVLCMAGLAVLAVAFWHWDVLSVTGTMPTFAGFDLFAEFLPRHHYAGAALRAGRMPLWDPTQAAGLPFVATWQAGFFYPPNALYGVLPTGLTMGVLARLHLFLSGAFAFLLAREVQQSRWGALLAGVTYMLCGSTVFMMYHTCAISAAPWLPAALLGAHRLGRRPTAGTAAALAAVMALQFLAGRDFAVVMTLDAVALLTLFQLTVHRHDAEPFRRAIHHLAFLAAAGLLTVGLIAIQAFPTLELAGRSGRTVTGLPAAMLEPFGPMPPQFFLANLVNPVRGPIRREYLGWIPVACALVGVTQIRRRTAVAYFTVLTLISLTLIFGSQTPAYAMYAQLPLGNVFRLPDRFVFLFSVGVAMLAGFGLDRLFERGDGRAFRPIAGILLVGAFCAFIGVGAVTNWLRAGVEHTARPWGWFVFYGLQMEHFGRFRMAAAYGAAALGTIVVASVMARRRGTDRMKMLLVLLAAGDLLFAFRSISPHPETSVTQALSASGCYRKVEPLLREHGRHLSLRLSDSYAVKEKDGELFGTPGATHYDPLVTKRHAVFFGLLQEGGTPIVETPWNDSSAFMGMLLRGPAPERLKLLDLLGVRAVIVDGRPQQRPRAFESIVARYDSYDSCVVESGHGPAQVTLLENRHAMPRASVVFDAVEVDDMAEAAEVLGRTELDPSRTVVLESRAPLSSASAVSDTEARATIAEYAENRVVVDVTTRAPGLLLLTDAYDPEWTATVNGRPTEIYPADVLFRGVAVPEGRSRVVFEYEPASFRLGALVSAVSALVGSAWVLWHRRAGHRRPVHDAPVAVGA
jgi:hypothetical protein